MFKGSGAGQRFYEGLCLKAVNQCIGRAVRHRNDYATVILLDQRYSRTATKNALPDWIRRSLQVCGFKECFNLIEQVETFVLLNFYKINIVVTLQFFEERKNMKK